MKYAHIVVCCLIIAVLGFIIGVFYSPLVFRVIYDNDAYIAYEEQGYVCYSGASVFFIDYIEKHEACHAIVERETDHFCK